MASNNLRSRARYAMGQQQAGDELVSLLGGAGQLTGDVFYLDPASGNDNNSGEAKDAAKKTSNAAIGLCAANNGDVIIRMKGTESVTETVSYDVAGISVIAQSYGSPANEQGEAFATYAAAAFTSGPPVTITAPTSFYGVGFSGRWVGATASAVLVNGEGGGFVGGWNLFHECRFMSWVASTNFGIHFDAGANNRMVNCSFDGVPGGFGFASGISFGGSASNNPTNNKILGCDFTDCTYAITHTDGTPANFLYKGNVVIDGKMLNSKNAGANGLVADNWYETATDTGTYDVAVATMQGNGIQFSGNHYSE